MRVGQIVKAGNRLYTVIKVFTNKIQFAGNVTLIDSLLVRDHKGREHLCYAMWKNWEEYDGVTHHHLPRNENGEWAYLNGKVLTTVQ